MNDQAFRALLARHALDHRDAPRRFAHLTVWWAALGHGAVWLLLTGTAALAVWLMAGVVLHGWTLWRITLLLLVGGLAWGLAWGLCWRQAAPAGRLLARQEAPALFQLVDRLCERCQAPRVDTLLINDSLEASLQQQACLGVLGMYRNHLVLGLPLLMALDVKQLAALLSHELGHLRHGRGKSAHWVYRSRRNWAALAAERQPSYWRHSPTDIVQQGFFDRFLPRFNARALVLARHQELQADKLAMRVAGSGAWRTGLASLAVHDAYLRQAFWPALWHRAIGPEAPLPHPLREMRVLLKEALGHPQAGLWLRDAVKALASPDDTQACLRERLALTGNAALVPDPPTTTAADQLLGARLAPLLDELDAQWQARHTQRWQEAGEARRRQELLVLELAQADPVERLKLDELLLWARTAWTLHGPAAARAPLRAALERHRAPTEVRYWLANALLAAVEPLQARSIAPDEPPELKEALDLLRSIIDDHLAPPTAAHLAAPAPDWTLPAARRLDTVLFQREAFEQLKPLREHLHHLEQQTLEAHQQLEDFDGPQVLSAATLSPRVLREALRVLANDEAVGRAWLLRKTSPAARGWVLHLLVVERSQALLQPDRQQWWKSLHERVPLPFNFMVLDLAHPYWADPTRTDLVNQFRDTAGACIYRR